jgi:hypothetical protein
MRPWFRLTLLAATALLAGCLTVPERPAASAAAPQPNLAAGRAAYDRFEDAKALPLLLPSAESGDRAAQFMVGRIYTRNRGVPVDVQRSIHWYERAVAQGAYQAANNLGIIYRFGEGVPVDMAKAAGYFRIAADGGMANGCYMLGVHLEQGQGVDRDLREALHWYEQADAAKDRNSLNQESRRDLGQRLELAQLRLKADEGDPRAMMSLAAWYAGGGSHLGKDVGEATRLRIAAAEVGYAPAQVMAGESLVFGVGARKDVKKAYAFFEEAASGGNPQAMVWMAQMNNGHLGFPRNDKAAIQWLNAAIALNHAPAMGAMAGAYENGLFGLKRDPAKARQWREREEKQQAADRKLEEEQRAAQRRG